MKTYKILNSNIVDKEKGILNNTFVRFIGPADSVFSLFIRSYGYRNIPTTPFNFHKYSFVIYDKNPLYIEMFKEMLKWDGNPGENFELFDSFLNDAKNKLKIRGEPFPRNSTLGKIMRRGFVDFKKYWDLYRLSNFTYLNIDAVNDSQEFTEKIMSLPDLDNINYRQFLNLNFNPNDYTKQSYLDAVNTVLHSCWLRSIKRYQTVVELSDNNNNTYEDYAGKLYSKLNPTFCILPWMHIQYKPSGQAKLCCRYDTIKEGKDFDRNQKDGVNENNLSELYHERAGNHSIQYNNIEQSFFSNYWNKARNLTTENLPISGCHKCYKEEQVPGEVATSMRLGSSILYNDGYLHKKPNFNEPKIEFLEVGFGNYCNLACLSCNSTLSTTWHDDEVKLNTLVGENLKRTTFPKLENLKFSPDNTTLESLKLIKFTGGEPMINPEFVKFIDLICENGRPEQISLEIYTNCSYIPSPKLLSNLAKFKDVQINLSIDAYGTVNDYIRFGSKWNDGSAKQTVDRSLDFWLEQGVTNKNFQIIMSTTLSVLNVFDVPKLMDWWMDKYKNSGNKVVILRDTTLPREYDGFFKLQLAFDPSYISMNILPADSYDEVLIWINKYETEFKDRYPEYGQIPECLNASLTKLKNTIHRCIGDKTNAGNFLEYLDKMDQIRGNSAEESIPLVVQKVREYLQAQDKLL